jgi:phosphoglycerol transferase MdoB-like AlkP superfamily enzyme
VLNISEPEDYSPAAIEEIIRQTEENRGAASPLYAASFAANGGEVQQPDIIFLMAESFWDVTALPGIEYDQPLLPNLERLSRQGAFGMSYSPSFGGGTCDVEFEALTGFSMEYLPSGAKPFQQYVTQDTFALPQYLKSQGYQTLAIHGYGRKFWNRDMAYPRLGIDAFIASDNFLNPELRRGFISDNAMVDRIIQEYENRAGNGPLFIHAVTMQNHTTYSRARYPEGQLVKVTQSPTSIPDATIGQLEDCATGIREMDAALGKLADYLNATERPAILVFWGDHMNPMSDGYALFENTGFIEKGDTASPSLYQTPLLYWSNFDETAVDIGTIAAYNITPMMMDLYGLEKPLMFEFLTQQLPLIRSRSKGVTLGPDNSASYQLTPEQGQYFLRHQMLQYDCLFGERLLPSYAAPDG